MSEICSGCGRPVPGGTAGCRAAFDELVGRDFADARFFASHRLFVDIYSLQHPDQFCRSAKSLAAHFCGLCLILEEGASAATGAAALRAWLDGPRALAKPAVLPADRGAITIADVAGIEEPAAWRAALDRWAASTWAAWRDLHEVARTWVAEAMASRR
jgi:hypothetical protein